MLDDPCEKCGHRRKLTMMSNRYPDISLTEMWRGDGEWWQECLLKAAVLVAIFFVVAFVVL